MANGGLSRLMGGSPAGVIIRLIFASILVGALMALLNIDPSDIFYRGVDTIHAVLGQGWGAVNRVGRWLLYGAMIVVPIWLISRLLSGRR